MNTSEELAPYVAQFVPIKLDTASDDYRQWNREHPSEGNGIPKVYIVRADGETLYAKPGALDVAELEELLSVALANGGRTLNEAEATFLIDLDRKMTELRENGKIAEAIKLLRKLRKFGKPGEFGSYATPAIAIETQVLELSEAGAKALERIASSLESATDEKQQLAALNDYLSVKDRFSELTTLKDPFSKLNRTITRDKKLNGLQKGLKALDRAAQASSDKRRIGAIAKLETLLEKYPEGALHERLSREVERLKNVLDK